MAAPKQFVICGRPCTFAYDRKSGFWTGECEGASLVVDGAESLEAAREKLKELIRKATEPEAGP